MKPSINTKQSETSKDDYTSRTDNSRVSQFFKFLLFFVVLLLFYIAISFFLLNILKTSYGDLFISIIVSAKLTRELYKFLQKKRILTKI